MTTHLLIAGHGRKRDGTFDPGATGFIKKGEHRYMKEDLFPAMKKYVPKGHKVIFFDDYNVFDRGNIVALAKHYKADEVTEFHYDATGSSAARGGHVIIHSAYAPDKTDLALRDAIDKIVGVRYTHRGHKGISGRSNLANVNRTKNGRITYRLLELGFGTNKEDARIMTENVDEYARELVKALVGKVKPTKKEGELTVSQYNDLKKEIDSLKRELAKKQNAPSNNHAPNPSHAEAWDWAKEQGLLNGKFPMHPLTREQFATVEYRKANK